jgi:NADPH-dependent curcumin reductase CurA
VAEVDVPDPGPGEVLVRNTWVSIDPAMRLRLDGAATYLPPVDLGAPLDGAAVGEVLASEVDHLQAGDMVVHRSGWRDFALVPGADEGTVRRIDVEVAPARAYLSTLGHTGLSAYAGLFDVARLREGDVVFVSSAAGAVGSLAGQMARLRGHRVIGSVGSDDKVAHLLTDLGFDAAFNYRNGPVVDALRAAAPDGIDVYFDNVGGEHLEAAIDTLRVHGRVAVCGTMASYGGQGRSAGLRNEFEIVAKRLRIQGFLIADHQHLVSRFQDEVGGWLRSGRLVQHETIIDGLENAPDAFLRMLRGDTIGKTIVRLR